jgi:hypothetical protein
MKKWILKVLDKMFHTPAVDIGLVWGTFIATLIYTGLGMALVMLILILFAVWHMNQP